MSDKMREALLSTTASLTAAVSLLERGGKKAAASDKMFAIMLDDYRKAIKEARAAFAKQPAQGEAVAWYDGNTFYANTESASMCCADMSKLRPVYYAPPAPVVPEGWKLESNRLLPILQSFADRIVNNGRSGLHHAELYEADHDTLMEAVRHLKQTATAPTVPAPSVPVVPDVFRVLQAAKKNAETSISEAEYTMLMGRLSGRDFDLIQRAIDAALAGQPAQGEAVDKGPWHAVAEHDNPVTGAWIESDDFAHDVRLYVNGDFADQGQRLAYAKRIADCLNAPPAPEEDVIAELIVAKRPTGYPVSSYQLTGIGESLPEGKYKLVLVKTS